jgi:hypothetical protein
MIKLLLGLASVCIVRTVAASADDLKAPIQGSPPTIGSEIARGRSAAGICGLPSGRGPVIYSARIDRVVADASRPVGGSAKFELGVQYSAFRSVDATLEIYRGSSPQGSMVQALATLGAADFARVQRLQRDLGLTDLEVCQSATIQTCQDIAELVSRWR